MAHRACSLLLAMAMLAGIMPIPCKVSAVAVIEMTVANGSTQTASPGGSVIYDIVVSNSGDAGAIVSLAVVETPPGWTARLSSFQAEVLAGDFAAFNLTVNVPGDAAADSVGKSIVVNGSYFSGGDQTTSVSTTTKVMQFYGVGLASEEDSKDCGQGETVIYTISVKNTGNGPEDIDLRLAEGNWRSWAALSMSSVQIGWNEQNDIAVSVRVPDGQGAGSYIIAVKAEVRGHSGAVNGSRTVNLTTTIFYGVELTTLEPNRSVRAGDIVAFNVTVRNKGSGNDTFDMSMMGPNSDWLAGFDWNNFMLQKDKSRPVIVYINIDKKAGMQDYFLNVKAASRGDGTKTAVLTLKVTLMRTSALRLESGTVNQSGRPGRPLVYDFRLINDGNGADSFKLDVPAGDASSWASLGNRTVTLPAGEEVELKSTIDIPNGTAAGNYCHTIKAWSAVNVSVFATLTFRTTVEAAFGFMLAAGEPSRDGKPGDTLVYNISVENSANAPDTFDIYVLDLPEGWQCDPGGDSISLPANSKAVISVRTTISGDYERSRVDCYSFTLRLTSRGNDSLHKVVTLTAFVEQVFGIELGPEMGVRRKTMDPYHDSSADFNLVVKNTGNGEDTVAFKAKRYPPGWFSGFFTFSPSALTVIPGNTTARMVQVSVASDYLVDLDAGAYDFDIVAITKSREESPPVTLTIDVVKGEVKDLVPADFVVDRTTLNKGEVLKVTVTIRNSGTSSLWPVVVTLYANGLAVAMRTITSVIKVGEEDRTTLQWTPDTTGTYALKITAKGMAEEPKELKLAQSITVVDKRDTWTMDTLPWLPWIVVIVVLILTQVEVWAIVRRRAQRQSPGPVQRDAQAQGQLLPRIVHLKCPGCGFGQDISDPTRPLYVKCGNCATRIRLDR